MSRRRQQNWLGERNAHTVALRRSVHSATGTAHLCCWVIGAVVEPRTLRSLGDGERETPRLDPRARTPRALPAQPAPALPSLAHAAVHGHA